MLKELFDLVRDNASDTVINNPRIPNEKNDEVVAEATNTVASGFRNIVAGGGVQSLVSLLNGSNSDKKSLLSNPIVSMMMGHFAGKLMNKYGLANDQANNLSGNLIPNILGSLINKTNDPNNQQFSLESLLGSITGNKNGVGGVLNDLLQQGGSGTEQSGGGGIMDIIKSLASGAQKQQQSNGDSLLQIIKGFSNSR